MTVIGALLTALSVTATGTAPAQASVPHHRIYGHGTVTDSNDKSTSVSCPAGQIVAGSGATVTGDGRQYVVLDQVIPSTTSVSAHAYEWEKGTSLTWSLIVWAQCVDSLTDHHIVWTKQYGSSPVNRVVTATCPAGTVLLSTGWQIEGARGEVMVDHVIPTKTSVEVSAYEVDGGTTSGFSGNWSLTAFARCAQDPGGAQVVSATNTPTSDAKTGSVTCPSGKVVTGGGYEVHGLRDRILVTSMTALPTTVNTEAFELISVSPGTWSIETYAVCVTE